MALPLTRCKVLVMMIAFALVVSAMAGFCEPARCQV
jgi:hypothetical protein